MYVCINNDYEYENVRTTNRNGGLKTLIGSYGHIIIMQIFFIFMFVLNKFCVLITTISY